MDDMDTTESSRQSSTRSSMDTQSIPQMSISQRRASLIDTDHDYPSPRPAPQPISTNSSNMSRSRGSISHSHPKPLPTPNRSATSIPHNLLPSAPASPPTPAPSPTPQQRAPSWETACEDEDTHLRDARLHFGMISSAQKQRYLAELLNMCDSQLLSFVHSFVAPRLKKDPFTTLPNELCLRILSFVDDPKTLARSSQVSRRWHELLNDDMTWKLLCEKHAYQRLGEETNDPIETLSLGAPVRGPYGYSTRSPKRSLDSTLPGPSSSAPNLTTATLVEPGSPRIKRRPKTQSYRSHFKQKYMVEAAWRKGGEKVDKSITPDQGVVTSLHLTNKYIVVALDNAKIHIFNTNGEHQKTLSGHVMGVWAMVPWDDVLVSGGCDRDVRVWNMATG
ncbi:MAG: hypothetical protein Q9227_003174 [Pyrenula ochraceoflavens]